MSRRGQVEKRADGGGHLGEPLFLQDVKGKTQVTLHGCAHIRNRKAGQKEKMAKRWINTSEMRQTQKKTKRTTEDGRDDGLNRTVAANEAFRTARLKDARDGRPLVRQRIDKRTQKRNCDAAQPRESETEGRWNLDRFLSFIPNFSVIKSTSSSVEKRHVVKRVAHEVHAAKGSRAEH